MENISDLIVEKRKERGLTQVELGAMLGISYRVGDISFVCAVSYG